MLWVMTVGLVIIGLMSAMILAGRHFLLIQIDEEREAVRAMGYPINLEELSAPYGEAPFGANAADHYRRLPGLYVPPTPAMMRNRGGRGRPVRRRGGSLFPLYNLPPPCQVMSQEVARANTRFLAGNKLYLDELRRALAIDVCRFTSDLKFGVSETDILLKASRVLFLEGRMLLEEGDLHAASECALEILGVAEHSCQTPLLISQLIGILEARLSADLVRAILCRSPFPTDSAAAISKRFEEVESFAPATDMIASALCSNRSFFDNPDIDGIIGGAGPGSSGDFTKMLLWEAYMVSGLLDADGLRSLRFFHELLEAAELPEHEQLPVMEKLHREFLTSIANWQLANRILMPAVVGALQQAYEHRAICRCIRTVLAVEQYRRLHGAPPYSLYALVPNAIDAVPADPFTGGPLKYRVFPGGYEVYSVGKDQRDDGGNEERDVVFSVIR